MTRFLRRHKPELQAIAVEPEDSPCSPAASPDLIEFRGSGRDSFQEPRHLALSGVETVVATRLSVGAAIGQRRGYFGRHQQRANGGRRSHRRSSGEPGQLIVTVAASCGERYLSTSLFQPNGKEVNDVRV